MRVVGIFLFLSWSFKIRSAELLGGFKAVLSIFNVRLSSPVLAFCLQALEVILWEHN